ncbi:DUF7933 domain-containing protein [Herminiimonas arsenitoxidans]|uniref:DUF7933 domain-containing protein n=1 Tax=Herminiimonas arsenitoxidans TaxID=1809410 RepID=UPI0009F95A9C|nr:SdrD B-like domain-containing protein [Herminiimonas arsenitoxidans]
MLRSPFFAGFSFLTVLRSASLAVLIGMLPMSAFAALTASVTTPDPSSFFPGEVRILRITLSNSVGTQIDNTAFDNNLPGTLPNGLKIAGTPTSTCGGTLTTVLGTQQIKLANGIIPASSSGTDGVCTIDIPVTAGTSTGSAASYDYQLGNGAVTGVEGLTAVANSGFVTQTFGVRALQQPQIAKSFGNSTLILGGTSTPLTVKVTNPNSVAIGSFNIADAFPQLGGNGIIKVAAVPNATASCSDGSIPVFSAGIGATTISGSGSLPASGSCTFTVNVEANQTNGAYTTGAQTNLINRTSDFSTGLGMPAAADAKATITVVSPLQVSKAFPKTALSSGEAGSFVITLKNEGNTALAITSFSDTPIDGVGGATATKGLLVTSSSNTCGGTTTNTAVGITLNGGSIPANGTCTVTVNFTGSVQSTGVPVTYTNSLPEGAVDVGIPAIRSQDASATILVADDLRILKSATPAVVAPGNPIQYQITVENYGVGVINNVTVTDPFSHGQTFLTGNINGINYLPTVEGAGCGTLSSSSVVGATSAVLALSSIPGRSNINVPGTCTVKFWAMTSLTVNTSTDNTIAAGGVCYNNGAGNICNGSPSNPTGPNNTVPVLAATKAFAESTPGVNTFSEGTIVRMTITLKNKSANPLTNVSISDTLKLANTGGGQLRIATPSNAASTCGTPTIDAVAGSTSIAMNGGTVPARADGGTGADGTCVLLVDVVGPAGVYPNTATVGGTETLANNQPRALVPLATNTPVLTYTSALTANKSFNPASIASGGKSTVTVQLLNSSTLPLTNVKVTDPLPVGMVLATPPNAYSTCAGTPVITGAAGDATISLTGANINAGGNCSLLFDVVATGSSNWVNTIPANGIQADGGVRNVVPVTATLTRNASTNLSILKSTTPSTLTFPGQVSQLTIDINNGTQAVTNMGVTDYFTTDGTAGAPNNGWVITANPSATTTCPGGSVVAIPGSHSVSLSIATLAANAACSIKVNVTSNVAAGVTNVIPAGALHTDQGLTNSSPAFTSLATSSNVGIEKQFTPNVVKPGERSRLRITFLNPTSQPLSNLSVIDILPANISVPSGANPTSTCLGATVSSSVVGGLHQVQVSGGNLIAATGLTAASCVAEIDVLVNAAGDYVNTIPANTVIGSSGGIPVTNKDPTSDTLRARAPLTVHKAFSLRTQDSGNPGGFTTGVDNKAAGAVAVLTLRFENSNSAPLTGLGVNDTLPTGLVVAPTPGASTTCAGGTVVATASATSIRVAGATVPANGFCLVTVNVLSNISGTYINTIPSAAVTTNEGIVNEEATSAKLIVSTPPTVGKQFSPAVIPAGGKSRLSIVIGNDNASTMTLTANFDDVLPIAPGQISVAAPPNMVSTCGGTVVAAAGATSVRLNNGGTIPPGGCTIDVDVTGMTAGAHTNNIPAGSLKTDLGNNQQPANAVLTISTQGYVSGKVFKDNNVLPNGTFENGIDTPIAGSAIELHRGATCNGVLIATAVTDTLGNYTFAGLIADTYTVCQPGQPVGTTNGITTAGTIANRNGTTGTVGIGSNPTTSSSLISNIVLNDNGTGDVAGSVNNNFAEVAPSSISGMVFKDINNDGIKNGADTPLANVEIRLSGTDIYGATVNLTTTTDANGNYTFSNVLPGNYSVIQPTQPPGTSNGKTVAGTVPNGGTPGTATAPTVAVSVINNIVLPPNTTSLNNNFAELPNSGTISGLVFLDFNDNGLVDGNDHGIGDQVINLTGTDENGFAVSRTTTTAANGTYSFTGLAAGTYTVTQPVPQAVGTTNGKTIAGSTGGTATLPAVAVSSISNIPLASNGISGDNNFAEVPGAFPDLAIVKSHAPASFAEGSSTGVYTVNVSNIGAVPSIGTITVVDTMPIGITAVAASGTGWICTNAVTSVTCTTDSVIASGANAPAITIRVAVAVGTAGKILVNTATVAGGGEPPGFESNNKTTDPTAIAQPAAVSGHVWLDQNHDRIKNDISPLERIKGWRVELMLNGMVVDTAITDDNGAYGFPSVTPSTGYTIRFRHPTTGMIFGDAIPNEIGATFISGDFNPTSSPGNKGGAELGDGTLKNLRLLAGESYPQQSLPLDPAGVVYNAVTREPVGGAVVTISGPGGFNPATHLVGGTANFVTGADGFYQFLLNGAPSGTYALTITTYPGGYLPSPSTMITGCTATLTVTQNPNPALVQNNSLPPTNAAPLHDPAACAASSAAMGMGAGSTQYYYTFVLDGNSAHVVNNHIPLDPVLGGAIVMTKSTPLVNVVRGDLVPYTITATNTLAAALTNINVVDVIPAGFRYRTGSASLNGVTTEPVVTGRSLTWANQTFKAGERKTWRMLLVVGTGVSEGEYINRVSALNNTVNTQVSNTATATVRVVPDPTFDCSDIIGKIFDDKNANGYQDQGEPGIANVRIATARGLLVTSDQEGRFHVACAAIPNADRGSNFVMKVDERTLPSGYRLTTENPRDVRVTRGKMVKLNFGATVHRVVRLELSGAAFIGDGTELQASYISQLEKLPEQLQSRPTVLRIAYRQGKESKDLAKKRIAAVSERIQRMWKEKRKIDDKESEPLVPLMIETELEGAQ